MISACDKFEGNFDDNTDFNAGGADPENFPPPYRGVGAARQTAASGTFTEIAAYADGKPIGYFQFPFSPSQVATTAYTAPTAASWPQGIQDPLRVAGPGTDFRNNQNNPVPTPSVYNFDPPGNAANPFSTSAHCHSPPGYVYNAFLDAYSETESSGTSSRSCLTASRRTASARCRRGAIAPLSPRFRSRR